jgi:hypothetical protein
MERWEYRQVTMEVVGQIKVKGGNTDAWAAKLIEWSDSEAGSKCLQESSPAVYAEALRWARTVMARLGKAGWELVDVYDMTSDHVFAAHYYFKHRLDA